MINIKKLPNLSIGLLLLFCLGCTYVQQAEQSVTEINIQGEPGNFHGFRMYAFEFQGRQSRIVVPKRPAKDNPWIWRARFFGHRPEVDMELLSRGFYVAYIDVSGLYGSPQAVEIWNNFYKYVTQEYDFSSKVVLEGMSRGGLIVFNWAAENTDKVSCIYADAPVCDIKSWPGGKMSGRGSEEDWKQCLEAYGLSEEEALNFQHNPIDHIEPIVEADIPLFMVSGNQDKVVPYEENGALIVKAYEEGKGKVKVVMKDGVGHVHGLDDARPIVNFILKHHR
ncbi:prolyl oligopeptidase family serine peptidase [Catalinimonas sp. 4WD22]|uniref:alpha/beta hydrolase family protein n=1 Tax=Catalinimonas locisalis TaxID=3133978 RepID=UPI003100B4C5